MKYLKKINENYIKDDVVEYIEQCFISLLDAGQSFDTKIYGVGENIQMLMFIDIPDQDDINIDGLLEFTEDLNSKAQEIHDCINKSKLKYPDVEYYTEMLRDTSYNGDSELYLTIKVEIIFRNNN